MDLSIVASEPIPEESPLDHNRSSIRSVIQHQLSVVVTLFVALSTRKQS